MFTRHSSAETARKPLERGRSNRRGSVVDWINGLTDNNQTKIDAWGKVDDLHSRRTRHGSVASVDEPIPDEDTQHKAELITKLKREVKVIMEEAVTRRHLDIHSAYATSLCGAVENCLLDGLRRRLLGLFGSRSPLALLHSVAKTCVEARMVLEKIKEMDAAHANHHLAWIRLALQMRSLSTIVQHIATCKSLRRLYDPSALMLDRAKGGMVAALLLGPCAVTFKRMSECGTSTAEELIERGRMPVSPNPARPPLQITRQCSSIVGTEQRSSISRDYVYSLHHNFKSSLLYGKNNVCVANGNKEPVKGYLSLHKNYEGSLTLKWTPNQLMHASSQPCSATAKQDSETKWLWEQAISLEISDIIYIHLHQRDESSPSTLTLVNCDGGQSPPLQLQEGSHSLVLLSSLETGLAPFHRLDPPLWTGQGKAEKILPRLRKRSTAVGYGPMLDYVFRIVRVAGQEALHANADVDPSPPPSPSNQCFSLPNSPYVINTENVDSIVNFQIGKACQSMRHQILARAFFGWLNYCRHLKTIRKHLMYLVDTREMGSEEGMEPVDEVFWKKCRTEKTLELEDEFLLRVYWKGIDGANPKELRRQIWPYLLKLFDWSEEAEPKTSEFTRKYRSDVDDWRTLEEIVRKQDQEAFIAARQRKSQPPERDWSMASDVFEEETNTTANQENRKVESEEDTILSLFATNLHRIDKDVERCDRNLMFFSNKENLESLRRVMCTYVRRNLEEGYIQGMCDILAPLLVVFEDEAMTLECFSILMNRLRENFPQKSGMDQCLSSLRSLIQVVDPQIFTLLSASSDFTHLYFSYRWFLLDFKRELSYDCTYKVWETIWAAGRTFSPHFALFFALAMVTNYREVIITNDMDFADLIKFFNEMAERHDCVRLLSAARSHVHGLQSLVQQLR